MHATQCIAQLPVTGESVEFFSLPASAASGHNQKQSSQKFLKKRPYVIFLYNDTMQVLLHALSLLKEIDDHIEHCPKESVIDKWAVC